MVLELKTDRLQVIKTLYPLCQAVLMPVLLCVHVNECALCSLLFYNILVQAINVYESFKTCNYCLCVVSVDVADLVIIRKPPDNATALSGSDVTFGCEVIEKRSSDIVFWKRVSERISERDIT